MRTILRIALGTLSAGALFVGCSSDSGPSGSNDPDAGGEDVFVEEVGPSDDATVMEVEVPTAPRAFRVGSGIPAQLDTVTWGADSLSAIAGRGDIVTIFFDDGLPWPEILSGQDLPPDYTRLLDELGAAIDEAGVETMVVLDPFDSTRRFISRDYAQRTVDGNSDITSAIVRENYARFCLEVAQRIEPLYMAPVMDINRVALERPEDFDSIVDLYVQAREAIQGEYPTTRVFPTWDFPALADGFDNQDELFRALIGFLDERLDVFAFSYLPSETLRGLPNIPEDDFDFIADVTTRPVAVIEAGYPADGFVRGGDVFASSEASQFNYLAFMFNGAERLDMDFVVWRAVADPNQWLAEVCEEEGQRCSTARGSFEGLRSHGLVDSNGEPRDVDRLWRDYAERRFIR